MPEATASLFQRLRDEPLIAPFILIGGTGLSLHLGHRLSEDLDFIVLQPKLPTDRLRLLINTLDAEGWLFERNDEPSAEDEFLNAGMALRDYSQSFSVNGTVKITFFAADPYHAKVLQPPPSDQTGFSIASLSELFSLKSLVASARSQSRDWLDLYLLIRDHGFSLSQWHDIYRTAGFSDAQFETALNRICSGHLPSSDPGFEALLPFPPSIESITEFFIEKRRSYELEESTRLLTETGNGKPTSG